MSQRVKTSHSKIENVIRKRTLSFSLLQILDWNTHTAPCTFVSMVQQKHTFYRQTKLMSTTHLPLLKSFISGQSPLENYLSTFFCSVISFFTFPPAPLYSSQHCRVGLVLTSCVESSFIPFSATTPIHTIEVVILLHLTKLNNKHNLLITQPMISTREETFFEIFH